MISNCAFLFLDCNSFPSMAQFPLFEKLLPLEKTELQYDVPVINCFIKGTNYNLMERIVQFENKYKQIFKEWIAISDVNFRANVEIWSLLINLPVYNFIYL